MDAVVELHARLGQVPVEVLALGEVVLVAEPEVHKSDQAHGALGNDRPGDLVLQVAFPTVSAVQMQEPIQRYFRSADARQLVHCRTRRAAGNSRR